MSSASYSLGERPMSFTELSDKAKDFDWNPRIGFKYWVRAADSIHHEGQVYLREGNYAQAYILLLRYSILVLEKLHTHPEASTPEAKRGLRPLNKRLPTVIEILEELRPRIRESYDEWTKAAAEREALRESHRPSNSAYARHAANDPALSWSYSSPAKILDAREHQDLAVDLAKKEMNRRRRLAGLPEDEERRRRGAGFWEGWNSPPKAPGSTRYADDDDLQRQMQATRRQLDKADDYAYDEYEDRPATKRGSTSYYYPSIARSSVPPPYEPTVPLPSSNSSRIHPPRPPKEVLVRPSVALRPAPPLPEKTPLAPSALRDYSPSPDEAPALPPKAAEPVKQKRVTFRPAAYLENGDPIRPVFLPSGLRKKFLDMASENTRRGLEMCGMLCGTPVNNALFITNLIIPEQKCTPDTCETENESSMLDYCITNDLIIIGWIHTHPTQTCFMSSRDLHTQAGYQVMMPESIAIVCAPRYEPSYGIFRLTNPPGLPHILGCQQSDTFHQHSITNLYTDAVQPTGHVYESSSLEFDVHDLRPK